MKRELRIDDVRRLLARCCEEAGGQAAFAKLHGLTKAYVSLVATGKRPPSERLCTALGISADGGRWVRK
jgi:DNA-binding transcriptional regulator YdaS (Cro superfamily)